MKYRVLYDTQLNGEFKNKDEEISFLKGTDEGYIQRLIREKIIQPIDVISDEPKENKKLSKAGK
ncbi:hypothetical protein [Helicobacter cappadocius]|uniref:Uncharacterized protein n=1 Tax=Helicobacter cappadocius TaxID=3063998 RepID=A0AA90PUF8_9HELI|nr:MULTISPECIES: hypothetical protein [unclassified Helicobacter]MDO7253883.1 hypothetical protein [Helicobacter sp. faydin-H75]MDP2539744.1 hypothetical protein [Helicobacter sp. faydin-H76]